MTMTGIAEEPEIDIKLRPDETERSLFLTALPIQERLVYPEL
jgi:hypothetical protein